MKYDVLIVGTGISGLYTALNLNDDINILIITKDKVRDCNSYLAQGGITTLLNIDDRESFVEDTLVAGNYKNNLPAVFEAAEKAIPTIDKLISFGVNFDKNNKQLNYTREGGHRKNRIVHVKDQTGKFVLETLLNCVSCKKNVTILEDTTLIDLIKYNGICHGGIVSHQDKLINIYANFTVLATGGIGGLFNSTTNVETLTGDGLSIALKNNIKLKDLEYLQLHPTVLYEPSSKGKRLLLSESLRGEGGIIVNHNKENFIDSLLPRDKVSAAILNEIKKTPNNPYVYLDMSSLSKDYLVNRFPYLYNECLDRGYKMESDLIPIAPAHHYCMGGIEVDLLGKTTLPYLYAVGEVSCTGIHGSNRLASNSLLEALVFSENIANDINIKIKDSKINKNEIIINSSNAKIDKLALVEYLKRRVDNRYAKLFNC